jgi:putative ABC transport system substrate-binding protein
LIHHDLIIELAARYQLPAVYALSHVCHERRADHLSGRYCSQYRRAAGYVDRILKGEKPTDLPVQEQDGAVLSVNSSFACERV